MSVRRRRREKPATSFMGFLPNQLRAKPCGMTSACCRLSPLSRYFNGQARFTDEARFGTGNVARHGLCSLRDTASTGLDVLPRWAHGRWVGQLVALHTQRTATMDARARCRSSSLSAWSAVCACSHGVGQSHGKRRELVELPSTFSSGSWSRCPCRPNLRGGSAVPRPLGLLICRIWDGRDHDRD